MENDNKIWKDVVGYEGYYKVSNYGDIYAVPKMMIRKDGRKLPIEGCMRKPLLKKTGYLQLFLNKEGVTFCHRVHKIVAQAFLENPENKPFVNHKNGIKTDNRVENLEWCTPAENNKHAMDTGLWGNNKKVGEEQHNAKLTEEQVKAIRSEYIPRKVSQGKLAKKYDVTQAVIWSILHRRSWKHL